MCTTCVTGICALFGRLVTDLHPPLVKPVRDIDIERQSFVPLTLRTGRYVNDSAHLFRAMVDASTGIGYAPDEFIAELAARSQFPEQVANWMNGKVPNELVRKIILTCAEQLIIDRGVRPQQSLLAA